MYDHLNYPNDKYIIRLKFNEYYFSFCENIFIPLCVEQMIRLFYSISNHHHLKSIINLQSSGLLLQCT